MPAVEFVAPAPAVAPAVVGALALLLLPPMLPHAAAPIPSRTTPAVAIHLPRRRRIVRTWVGRWQVTSGSRCPFGSEDRLGYCGRAATRAGL